MLEKHLDTYIPTYLAYLLPTWHVQRHLAGPGRLSPLQPFFPRPQRGLPAVLWLARTFGDALARLTSVL